MVRRLGVLVLICVLPACQEIEEILEEQTPAVDTIESGSFDRLWDAAQVVLRRDFDVVDENRERGTLLARGRPAEFYDRQGTERYYPDMTSIIVEVKIYRQPPRNVLALRAAQESDIVGPDRMQAYSFGSRRSRGMVPGLMPAPSVEQALLRKIREEVERQR